MKLVDIAATAALTFHGTGSAAISDSSLKDWLTARATAYDNILLSTTQVKNMEPCRRLGGRRRSQASSLLPGNSCTVLARSNDYTMFEQSCSNDPGRVSPGRGLYQVAC